MNVMNNINFKEGKAIIGKQTLGDTRGETKRRQAAVKAKQTLQEVTKPSGGRKPALKRLGTMAKTARVSIFYLFSKTDLCAFKGRFSIYKTYCW